MDGNNPVHLAAINGYTNTMVAILSIHSHLVNAENRAGVRIIRLSVNTYRKNIIALELSRSFCYKQSHSIMRSPNNITTNFKFYWATVAILTGTNSPLSHKCTLQTNHSNNFHHEIQKLTLCYPHFSLHNPGRQVVGQVKKVGKSRNFHQKVGKSRNFFC